MKCMSVWPLAPYFRKSIPLPAYSATAARTSSGVIHMRSRPVPCSQVSLMRLTNVFVRNGATAPWKSGDSGPPNPMMLPAR